jgi:hypothetical protein
MLHHVHNVGPVPAKGSSLLGHTGSTEEHGVHLAATSRIRRLPGRSNRLERDLPEPTGPSFGKSQER